jgi:hypothetical protein
VVPGVRQRPAEGLAVVLRVRVAREALFFSFFVQILDIKVNFVLESFEGYESAAILIAAVGVDTDDDLRELSAVREYFGLDLRFIEYIFAADLTTDGVDLSNLGHHFLQLHVNFAELLVAQLIVLL